MSSVYILDGGRVLLIYRVGSRVVGPSWCGVGGHFEPGELNDARACALRELKEEIGLTAVDLDDLRLRYVTLRLKTGELRQVYYFFARLRPGVRVPPECDEGRLSWFDLEALAGLTMPHTARGVIDHYLRVGCGTDALYGGVATADGVDFEELREF